MEHLKNISKGICATLIVFAFCEVFLRAVYFIRKSTVTYIPLVYSYGTRDAHGSIVPPWLDQFRIFQRDKALIWKNKPSINRRYLDLFTPVTSEKDLSDIQRKFIPRMPASLKDNPMWEIFLNSDGFRDEEFPKKKPSNVFRIICLGDSWTFGSNVDQAQAYPQRLGALLKSEFSAAQFEIFNLGVMGYSSFQGLELLRQRIEPLAPDVVVVGFAMNDSSFAGYRDKDMPSYEDTKTFLQRAAGMANKFEFYKLLRYFALVLKEQPKSIGERLREAQAKSASENSNLPDPLYWEKQYASLEPWVRVSPSDYENNIREIINLARRRQASVALQRAMGK